MSLFTTRRIGFLAIITVMVFLAGILQPQMLSMRKQELVEFAPPGELPPIVLLTQALGAFRSIAIDVLWIRTMDLKQEGKFFELAQLYDLICQLEPHFADIWIHNAWNMAYNISVELPTGPERWSWVKKGISLLRDKAIPLNPREGELHKELSWIYLHKIGDDLDNMHRYYKTAMVLDHERLLGPEQDIEAIVQAPDSTKELFEDKDVQKLFDRLKDAGKNPLEVDLMAVGGFSEEQFEILMMEENAGPAKRLLDFLRKEYLLEELKLDPEKMLKLEEKYGKLDWRMPEVHGLYWIEESIPLLKYDEEKNPLFYHRYIYTAFREMFERGEPRIFVAYVSDPKTGETRPDLYVEFSPAVKWVDKLDEVYVNLIGMLEGTNKFSVGNAYKNWLKSAVYWLYIYNEENKAREYHKKYVKMMMERNRSLLDMPFEVFVLREATDYLTKDEGPDRTMANVKGLILQSLEDRDLGFDDRATGLENLSKMLYDEHVEEDREYLPRFGIGEYKDIYEGASEEYRKQFEALRPPGGAESEE